MRNLLLLVPAEWTVFLIVGAGLAMIVGARRLAGGLLAGAIALAVLPALLAPLFEALPTWLLVAMLACFGFGVIRALLELSIGKRAADNTVGILAADVIRFSVLAPVRLAAWIVRLFLRR